jgi:type II secretory ATPase GspE/PulE/Tfp pilus assembly ATPase PilB-like protein
VNEREGLEMEPLLREVLRSEPDIVAWLELREEENDDEELPGVGR